MNARSQTTRNRHEEASIVKMRHLDYLGEEHQQNIKKMSFHLSPQEQELLKDPNMARLLQVSSKNPDGSRSFQMKKKRIDFDLTKLTEKERLKLHRRIMRAQAGRESDSSEEDLPEYMFPERDLTAIKDVTKYDVGSPGKRNTRV